jgi:hypothetical protein
MGLLTMSLDRTRSSPARIVRSCIEAYAWQARHGLAPNFHLHAQNRRSFDGKGLFSDHPFTQAFGTSILPDVMSLAIVSEISTTKEESRFWQQTELLPSHGRMFA